MSAVQVAALTNQARSQQDASAACDIRKSDANKCVAEHSASFTGVKGMNVVFVIDMTASMQPHIDAVKNAVRDAARALSAKFQGLQLEAAVRLGRVPGRSRSLARAGV
ncbi:hypothetical protein NKJ35_28950 [Mesorhizobium sp. M0136]|uniref:hypothetical protein n=1 Tax=Mesorhizobium sp. M0136 TaxID=2956890 RepID=UPI00333B2FAA